MITYPVIFTALHDDKDTVLIEIPDLSILTEGYGIANAVSMARDAIALKAVSAKNEKKEMPKPSPVGKIDESKGTFSEYGKGFIFLVAADFTNYQNETEKTTGASKEPLYPENVLNLSLGQKIKFFRKKKGLTGKQFGQMLGFSENTADVRIAQYEAGKRIPRTDLLEKMAKLLEVNVHVLKNTVARSELDIIYTLFALENVGGIKANDVRETDNLLLNQMLLSWKTQEKRLKDGKMTKAQYDNWRYSYNGK